MTETIGVVVATYGDARWAELAAARALPSVMRQTSPPDQVEVIHGHTLHDARNEGAWELSTDHVIFLDADDELDERYVEAMRLGRGDVRQPSTIGCYPDGRTDAAAVLIPSKPLREGNFLVIGSRVRRSMFLAVGGFQDWPAWEDWDLFVRLSFVGAEITACPEAIYRVHVSPSGRNALTQPEASALAVRMWASHDAFRLQAVRRS